MKNSITRRGFLKAGIAVGTGFCGLSYLSSFERSRPLKTLKGNSLDKKLVVVHGDINGSNDESSVITEMTRRGVRASQTDQMRMDIWRPPFLA